MGDPRDIVVSLVGYTPPSGSNAFEADVIGGHPLPCLGRAALKVWASTTDWCSSRWAIVCRRSVGGSRSVLGVPNRTSPRASIEILFASRSVWRLMVPFCCSFSPFRALCQILFTCEIKMENHRNEEEIPNFHVSAWVKAL